MSSRASAFRSSGTTPNNTTAHRPTAQPNRSSKSAQRIEFDQLQTVQNNEPLSTRQPSDIGTFDRSKHSSDPHIIATQNARMRDSALAQQVGSALCLPPRAQTFCLTSVHAPDANNHRSDESSRIMRKPSNRIESMRPLLNSRSRVRLAQRSESALRSNPRVIGYYNGTAAYMPLSPARIRYPSGPAVTSGPAEGQGRPG